MKREMPETVKDVASWDELQELDEHGNGLTQWEINFVESLMKQLRNGSFLSAKQREILERIRDEKLGGGSDAE